MRRSAEDAGSIPAPPFVTSFSSFLDISLYPETYSTRQKCFRNNLFQDGGRELCATYCV